MASNSSLDSLTTSTWQTIQLRLTAFPDPKSPVLASDADSWWSEIVGQQPEKRTSQPRTGQQVDEGSYDSGKLILVVSPSRIDWVYQADEELNQSSEERTLASLGTFPETLDRFLRLTDKWFDSKASLAVNRLALGVVLEQKFDSRSAAYTFLGSLLPFSVDAENSRDFVYQINRPRTFETLDLKINRLAKWWVPEYRTLALLVGTTSVQVTNPLYTCRLELDINSDAEYDGSFEGIARSALFKQLAEWGIEIANKGDIV